MVCATVTDVKICVSSLVEHRNGDCTRAASQAFLEIAVGHVLSVWRYVDSDLRSGVAAINARIKLGEAKSGFVLEGS